MYTCKIQHFNFEEGEFDKIDQISSEDVLKFFHGFDWAAEISKKREGDVYPNLIVQCGEHLMKVYIFNDSQLDFLYFPPDKKIFQEKRNERRNGGNNESIPFSEICILKKFVH